MVDTVPMFGWLCTNRCLLTMAEAMLDEEYEAPSMKPGQTNLYRKGRIGSLNVAISCLPEPPRAADAANMAAYMATSFSGIKAILITGIGDVVPNAAVRLGDLVISPVTNRYNSGVESNSTPTSNIVQDAVNVLQREAGADGHWLSSNPSLAVSKSADLSQFAQRPSSGPPNYPQLHYGNMGLQSQETENEQLRDRLVAIKNIKCFDIIAAGLTNLRIPVIVILGINNCADLVENDVWNWYAAANTASYGKEFIQVMTNNLRNSVPDLRGTEKIVPPNMDPRLPPFQLHQYPNYGNAVLLVIPTENESKGKLLQESFRERAPNDVIVHTVTISINSGVGEQPYNGAGIIGAHNRISNTLLHLHTEEYQEIIKEKRIGLVIVASIESYIQTDNVDRPADYGLIVIHNASKQQTTACISCGVTVPPEYVNRARRFGFEGDQNRGRVTVGQILAAHVPGLDKADWHLILAGRSRYDLLKDAIRQLSIPW